MSTITFALQDAHGDMVVYAIEPNRLTNGIIPDDPAAIVGNAIAIALKREENWLRVETLETIPDLGTIALLERVPHY